MTRSLPSWLFLTASATAFLLGASWPASAVANPGDLDPTFGSGGKVITTFPGQVGNLAGAYAVALQPDGKIVAAGWAGVQFALARYNPDGSLDTTFGSGGRVRTSLGGSARGRALALQPDGKIVVAGTPGFRLARYNPDGSPDLDFGAFGTISTDLGSGSNAFALGLQSDGKLVVAGQSKLDGSGTDFAVARYTPEAFVVGGGLDGSFGTGGVATTDVRFRDEAFAVAVQPDGKIVAAGRASASAMFGPSVVALARYHPDGSADLSFGGGGQVTTAFNNGDNDRASALALQPDGKIVVAGVTATNGGGSAFAVARYNADGSLDGTFGSAGQVITVVGDYLPSDDSALAVVVQPDGAIVVGGDAATSTGQFALVRYTSNGSLDSGFGNAGRVITAFSQSGSHVAGNGFYGLALQPDGKIVAAGVLAGEGAFALARYQGGPGATPLLVAAILPSSRSVEMPGPATAFATVINAGTTTASNVSIGLATPLPGSFAYQTTDPSTNAVTGLPNTPVDIEAGLSQSFVIAFTPSAPIAVTDVRFTFAGSNAPPVAALTGVNTLLLSASPGPVPDVIALAATVSPGLTVEIPGETGASAFAVAAANVGVGAAITVTADTGSAVLPLAVSVCQTTPTGACGAPPAASVTTAIASGETPTFSVFAQGAGLVPFDPANHRIFVRFRDASGVTRGATSVAVRTQ
jgi:uncharacterized delta-60 repeat protein